MPNKKQKPSGFTIVELLVVIVVIGILAAITIVSYTGISSRAIVASLQSDLANASQQLKIYQTINNAYPTLIDDCPTPAAANVCLKSSNGNTFTSYVPNNGVSPQTFSLTNVNTNGVSYRITNDTPPTVGGVATAPTNLVATGGSTQASLTWTAPTSDGGFAITGYKLYRGTTASPTTLVQTLGNVTSYTNTGLTAGTTYYFRVQAINSTGDSDYSNNASATTTVVVNLTYSYTGAVQTWVVPAGVTSVNIQVWGAQGGQGYGNSGSYTGQTGGLGGYTTGTLSVTPGQTLYIYVGGAGGNSTSGNAAAGGFNGGGGAVASTWTPTYGGGGGGGASDVRLGVNALANRVIVGGGGGGGGSYNGAFGGYGGYPAGQDGSSVAIYGTGGTQSAAGSPRGSLGLGGSTTGGSCGGGGGGGYYGGGSSGDSCNTGGAGGGSSYYGGMNGGTGSATNGTQSGNGSVIIHN